MPYKLTVYKHPVRCENNEVVYEKEYKSVAKISKDLAVPYQKTYNIYKKCKNHDLYNFDIVKL